MSESVVVVSGEYPFISECLAKQGIEVIKTAADERLPKPVQYHPDMQLCVLDKKTMFVLRNSVLKEKLKQIDIAVNETTAIPTNVYPSDVLCNAFTIKDFLIGNMNSLDSAIRAAAKNRLTEINVKQGYAACSVAVVGENAVITADSGIAAALRRVEIDVLEIRSGYINLPGYNTGFIGGCCGLISPKILAVSGRLRNHPDGEKILGFLRERNVDILELHDGDLIDIGGIVSVR